MYRVPQDLKSSNVFPELAPPDEFERAEPNSLLDRLQEVDLVPVLVFVVGMAFGIVALTLSGI